MEKVKLLIQIRENQVDLQLFKGKELLDKVSWQDKRDLLERLLPEIDGLLGKNGLMVKNLGEVKEDIDSNKSHSTYRIVKATVKTFNVE